MGKLKAVLMTITFLVFGVGTTLYKLLSFPKKVQTPILRFEYYFVLHRDLKLLMLCAAIYLGVFVQALVLNYNMLIPYNGFLLIISFFWSVLCYYFESIHFASNVVHLDVAEIVDLYIPVFIFNIAFCMDLPHFIKTLPQVIMIGIVVEVATAVVYGWLAMLAITGEVDTRSNFIMGMFSIPMHSHSVINMLKQQSTRTKHIGILLEGETLFGTVVSHIFYSLYKGVYRDWVVYWYQQFAVVMRMIIMDTIIGMSGGYIGRMILRRTYTRCSSVFLTCFAIPFFTFGVASIWGSGCGSLAMLIVGVMLGFERSYLPKEYDALITDFWQMLVFIFDVYASMRAIFITVVFITPHLSWERYIVVTVIYLLHYVIRFVCFLIFSPIIGKLGYEMNLKNTIVCVWSGIKGPLGSLFLSSYFQHNILKTNINFFFFYISGVYILSVLINGTFTTTVLDVIKLRVISFAKQSNMTTCMKNIFAKRERTIAAYKMNRFMTDISWPKVAEITTIKHPYQLDINDDDDQYRPTYEFTWCDLCKKDVLQEPTVKQMIEIRKEAKMRILKAKKMSYSRQYENGMISKQGVRILCQAIEIALDSEQSEINLEEMCRKLYTENCFKKFIRRRAVVVMEKLEKKKQRRPRTYWRRVCYHIILADDFFDKLMLVIVAIHSVMIIVTIMTHHRLFGMSFKMAHFAQVVYIFLMLRFTFCLAYIMEMVMKILAYSWIRVWDHGVRRYFKSFWNITDFIALISCTLDIINTMIYYDLPRNTLFDKILNVTRLVRLVRLLRVFDIFYSEFITFFDKSADLEMTLTFELVKCYIYSTTEILAMLPYMIENKKVREDLQNQLETQRTDLYKLLRKVQREKPWIGITVKTTQAIRMVLRNMNDAINQLKLSGWVDLNEYSILTESLEMLYKKVNSIKRVVHSPPEVIFKEVPWMAENKSIIEFLFDNVTLRTFDDGDVVLEEGHVADGIYIIVTGVLLLYYKPNERVRNSLRLYGQLPIVDYFPNIEYEKEHTEQLLAGNCLGELGTLTQRLYDCTIKSDGRSAAYFIPLPVVKRAMELTSKETLGLESRIWKEIALRIAVPVLQTVPVYQNLGPEHIKFVLERAFVPNLSRFKIFSVSEMIEDIILIEGVVIDFNTKNMYRAPCYIPRTIQKLILPTSSLWSLHYEIKPVLLIIPLKDVDEIDVMMFAEDTCEIMRSESPKCLMHTIKDRKVERRKMLQSRRRMKSSRVPRVYTCDSIGSQTKSVYCISTTKSDLSESLTQEEEEANDETYIEFVEASEVSATKRRGSMFFK